MRTTYYSEAQVRKAFWDTFHKSGELFFDYVSPDRDCIACTESMWQEFEDNLKGPSAVLEDISGPT